MLFSPLSASYELGAAFAYDLSTKQMEEDNIIVEFDQNDIEKQTARSEAIFNAIDTYSVPVIHKFLRGRRRKSTMQDFQLTLNILENRAPEALDNFRSIFKQAQDADKKIMCREYDILRDQTNSPKVPPCSGSLAVHCKTLLKQRQ